MKKDEENFEEAEKAVNTAFHFVEIPLNLKKIFEDDSCQNLSKQVGI